MSGLFALAKATIAATHQFESLAEAVPEQKTCLAAPTTSRSLVTLSKQVPRPGGVTCASPA